jgi:putative ABC transport system permease protein
MLFKISWRNIWRNKLRSTILIISIVLGVLAGATTMSLSYGIVQQRFENSIKGEISHFQIHHPDFISEQEVQLVIENADAVCQKISADVEGFKSLSARCLVTGIASTAISTSGISIKGVNAEQERNTTAFHEKIIEGSFFETEMRNPLIIGKKLATKLKAQIGSRVILSFMGIDGEIVTAAFRVQGIYKTVNNAFDESMVYTAKKDMQSLIGNENAVHEIAVLLDDNSKAISTNSEVATWFPALSVRSWRDISPELRYMMEQSGFALYIFLIIILLGLGFGILNTMLMAVFERTRELGMLMSIGMNKWKVFMMIMLETLFISLSGGIIGVILTHFVVAQLNKVGIDFSAFSDALSEFGYDSIVYPKLQENAALNITILVFIIAMLSAIYPAIKAIKLSPAEAIRK